MTLLQPGEKLFADERMVASKGRFSFCQFIPNKPTRFGFKLWVLAESHNGYTWNFEVYTGRAANNQPEVGLAQNVVMRLTEPLLDQGNAMY